jgi:hypothetical protein
LARPLRDHGAARVDSASPGGSTSVASGSSNTHGPQALNAARLAAQDLVSSQRSAKRARRVPRRARPRAAGAGAGPGSIEGQADVDEITSPGVAIAVAALVLGLEGLAQLGRVWALCSHGPRARRPAAVASSHVTALGLLEAVGERARSAAAAAIASGVSSARAAAPFRAMSRRSEAISRSAERTPLARGQTIRSIPSSSASAVACIAGAERQGSAPPRGSTPRSTVTTARRGPSPGWRPDDPLRGLGPSSRALGAEAANGLAPPRGRAHTLAS